MDSLSTIAQLLKSRLLLLLLCIFCDYPVDHDATGVSRVEVVYTSWLRGLILKPFTKWDSVYYIQIASDGYTDEKQLAFFPLYPMSLSWLSGLSTVGNMKERIIASGVLLNLVCFVMTYFVLQGILKKLALSKDVVNDALYCFIANPANVFFTTLYTESLFSFLSWLGMYLCLHDASADSAFFPLLSCIPFFLASCTRSNGTLNVVFVLVIAALRIVKDCTTTKKKIDWESIQRTTLVYSCVIVSILLPFTLWSHYSYSLLCNVASPSHIGSPSTVLHYCTSKHYWLQQSPYAYVQGKYWGIGPFHYYQWKQTPNFLLALPITMVVGYYLLLCTRQACAVVSRRVGLVLQNVTVESVCDVFLRINQTVPLALCAHLVALLLIGYVYCHVQIITRLLCSSSPLVYVALGQLLQTRWWKSVVVYLLAYNIVGTVLHVNHYPWT